jgi:hypothetical protein
MLGELRVYSNRHRFKFVRLMRRAALIHWTQAPSRPASPRPPTTNCGGQTDANDSWGDCEVGRIGGFGRQKHDRADRLIPHPAGERSPVEEVFGAADTFGGRVHVERDAMCSVTPLG